MKRSSQGDRTVSKRTKTSNDGHESINTRENEGIEKIKSYQDINRHVFKIAPVGNFDKKFPYFRQPVEFGAFSLGIDRKFKDSKEKLRQYLPPDSADPGFDLNIGFKTFVERNEDEKERLDHLLEWINQHREKFRSSSDAKNEVPKCLNTDFITWRGHLVKILCTPYEKRDSWRLDACRYNGTVFICEVETDAHRRQRLTQTQRQKEMCYWGYKFEDYMTKSLTGDDSIRREDMKVINNCEAFCSVVRARLNKHSLLFGAEVDCCSLKNGKVIPSESYVELKTSRIMDSPRLYRNFANFKLLKYWAQSYLAGVPTIVCGLRDDNGIVRKIETFPTLEIPKIARKDDAKWNPSVCLNFCDEFLAWVKSIVVEDDRHVVYSFIFEDPFQFVKVEKRPYGTEVFLPNWF